MISYEQLKQQLVPPQTAQPSAQAKPVAQPTQTSLHKPMQPGLISQTIKSVAKPVGQFLQSVPEFMPAQKSLSGQHIPSLTDYLHSVGQTASAIGEGKFAQGGTENMVRDVSNIIPPFLPIGGIKTVAKPVVEGVAKQALNLAKSSNTVEDFVKALNTAKPEIKQGINDVVKTTSAPIKTVEDFFNHAKGITQEKPLAVPPSAAPKTIGAIQETSQKNRGLGLLAELDKASTAGDKQKVQQIATDIMNQPKGSPYDAYKATLPGTLAKLHPDIAIPEQVTTTATKPQTFTLYRGEGKVTPVSKFDSWGKNVQSFSLDDSYPKVFGQVNKSKETFNKPLILKTQADLQKVTDAQVAGGYDSVADWARAKGYDGFVDYVSRDAGRFHNPPGEPINPGSTSDYLKQLEKEQANTTKVERGGIGQRIGATVKDFKRIIVDSAAPIEDTLGAAKKAGKFEILPSKDIHPQIDMAIRSKELGGQFLQDNGMVDVIRNAPKLNELNQYLIAKHAPEVGVATGRNAAMDAQLVRDLAPTYEPYAQKVGTFSKLLLNYMVDSGLINKNLAGVLNTKYPNYVPLDRLFNELEKSGTTQVANRGIASLSKQSAVQKFTNKGSLRAIRNPLDSLVAKTTTAFQQGERNKAGEMLASYKNLPGNPFQLRELKSGEHAINKFSYLDNGVKKTFETTRDIANAAKFLDKRQLGFWGNVFAIPTRIARVGITGISLPFAARNVVRDQTAAFINSNKALQTSIANPKVFVGALWDAIGHGKGYQEWIRQGGGGTSFDISRSAPEVSVKQIRAGKNAVSNIAYTVSDPMHLLRAAENIINRGEEFTRLQQYKGTYDSLIREGRTPQDAKILAATASRENTTNFGRSGDWGKALNAGLLYLNAGIQGARTLVRNLQNRPIQTSAKIGLSVFAPLATITAWNLSDPKRKAAYDKIQDYERDSNLIIIPPDPVLDPRTGTWNAIKIPLSQEIANLTVPVRQALESLHGEDSPGFADFAQAVIGSSTSLNVQSPLQTVNQFTPQLVKPTLEASLNKNLFTGKDVVPQYLNHRRTKDLTPSQQTFPDTSGTARKIAGPLNVSPITVEHFIKSAAGTAGSQVLNASDQVLAAMGIIPKTQIGGQSIPEGFKRGFGEAQGGKQKKLKNLPIGTQIKSKKARF